MKQRLQQRVLFLRFIWIFRVLLLYEFMGRWFGTSVQILDRKANIQGQKWVQQARKALHAVHGTIPFLQQVSCTALVNAVFQ